MIHHAAPDFYLIVCGGEVGALIREIADNELVYTADSRCWNLLRANWLKGLRGSVLEIGAVVLRV